jgi:hypothetical protein
MEPPRRTRLRGPIQGSLKFSRLVMGGPSPSGTHQRLPSASPQTKYGAFPLPWFCCQGLISTVHRSDCRSALTHFADTSTYRARRSQSTRRMAPHGSSCWGGDDSLLFPPWLCQRSTPSTPLGSWGLPFQALHPFRGLRPEERDSAPSCLLAEVVFRRGRLRFMLRTAGLHPPKEGSTPRFDAQVSPNAGGLLQR